MRDVHGVADRSEVGAAVGADVADDHDAGVDADADRDRHAAIARRRELRVAPLDAALDLDRGGHGAQRVVGLRNRRAEVGHHRVADEFVDRAAALEDDVGDQLEALVQQADHVVRGQALGEARELADVGEQDRHLALDAGLLLVVAALEQLVQHVVVDVAAERALDALLLLERVAHLVERARQLADLVPRGRRHAHGHVAGREALDADAQPPQRADQQRHEADSREHADHHDHHGHGRELLGVARTTGSTSTRRSNSTCASPMRTSL